MITTSNSFVKEERDAQSDRQAASHRYLRSCVPAASFLLQLSCVAIQESNC